MRMFSNCSGTCYTCACSGMCLAGHGDDDYMPASKESIVERANKELDRIGKITEKQPNEIISKDLSELNRAKEKLKIYIEALAKGSW